MTEQDLMDLLLKEARDRGAIEVARDAYRSRVEDLERDLTGAKTQSDRLANTVLDLRAEITVQGQRELEAITALRQLTEAAHRLAETPKGKRLGPRKGALTLAAMGADAILLKTRPF